MGSISLHVGHVGEEIIITKGLSEGSPTGSFGVEVQELKAIIVMKHSVKMITSFIKVLFTALLVPLVFSESLARWIFI